jgi:hypothetical protein
MRKKICYWSVSWGDYDYMLQSLVNSFHKVGMTEDFVTFTEKPIKNSINYRLDSKIENDRLQFFKFEYLKQHMYKMDYDIFVFIDADHFFVRKPDIKIEDILQNSPWHSFLESPLNMKNTQRKDWWGVPNQVLVQLMRKNGVLSTEIRNSNGGFWICHKNFIHRASELAYMFHNYLKSFNITVPEEVSIAYLSHLMSPVLKDRFLENFTNYWASDWTENFKDVVPIDREWEYTSYMTYEKLKVKPAIVHGMRSKKALVELGKKFISDNT